MGTTATTTTEETGVLKTKKSCYRRLSMSSWPWRKLYEYATPEAFPPAGRAFFALCYHENLSGCREGWSTLRPGND